MRRREEWRKVLDAEVQRWSAKSCDELVAALRELQAYELAFEGKNYQVEVELLENTASYLHVMVAIDDGSLPASILPLSESFIRQKDPTPR
jgi:hypothetical protein